MVKITTTHPIFSYISGAYANSVTDVTVINGTANGEIVFYYNSSEYTSPTIYLEVYAKSVSAPNATVISLYDIGTNDYASAATGTQVTGSEITTSSTTSAYYRSGAISLTNGNRYTAKIRNTSASTTVVVYHIQIVIIDDVGTSPSTLYNRIPIYNYNYRTSYSTTSASGEVTYGGRFYYDGNLDDGTVEYYLEGHGHETVDGIFTVYLYDVTSSATVSGSTLNFPTNSTTYMTRMRSSALTLTSGHTYAVYYNRTSTAGTGYLSRLDLIKKQSGTITKTSVRVHIGGTPNSGASGTTYAFSGYASFKYVSADWSSPTIYFEAWNKISSASYTAYAGACTLAGTTAVGEVTTTSTSYTIGITASLTLTDATYYSGKQKSSSSSGTAIVQNSYLMFTYTFSAAATYYYPSLMQIGYWGM